MKGTVYRGVSYDPLYEVGQITTFKQFNSTSTSKNVAHNFANPYLGVKHIFQIEIESGYPIS